MFPQEEGSFMKITALVIGLLFGATGLLAAETYPQPNLLVEPTQLAMPEDAAKFVILDARSQQQYETSHIPAARWVDPAAWARDFSTGTDDKGWSKKIGQLGITAESQVLVYDDNVAKDAARIWWILKYWGVKDVRLLNGGWSAWVRSRLPAEIGHATFVASANLDAKSQIQRLATKQQLLKKLNDKEFQIVDARSAKEFCGSDKMQNKRAGAIPGAKNIEWITLIDPQTQRFKSPNELQKLFQESGIDLNKPITTHCQSGGRAAVMAFGMELMGAPNVSLYYASWSEWGNADDTPVIAETSKRNVNPPK